MKALYMILTIMLYANFTTLVLASGLSFYSLKPSAEEGAGVIVGKEVPSAGNIVHYQYDSVSGVQKLWVAGQFEGNPSLNDVSVELDGKTLDKKLYSLSKGNFLDKKASIVFLINKSPAMNLARKEIKALIKDNFSGKTQFEYGLVYYGMDYSRVVIADRLQTVDLIEKSIDEAEKSPEKVDLDSLPNFTAGIADALKVLSQSTRNGSRYRAIVLITDGQEFSRDINKINEALNSHMLKQKVLSKIPLFIKPLGFKNQVKEDAINLWKQAAVEAVPLLEVKDFVTVADITNDTERDFLLQVSKPGVDLLPLDGKKHEISFRVKGVKVLDKLTPTFITDRTEVKKAESGMNVVITLIGGIILLLLVALGLVVMIAKSKKAPASVDNV